MRAHAGLWALVALLGTAMVFTAVSVGPTITRIEDNGLRQMTNAARTRNGTWSAPGPRAAPPRPLPCTTP